MAPHRTQPSVPSSQTDGGSHRLPDTSAQPITVSHARVTASPRGSTTFGCVCGDTFSRVDALNRHISNKNNRPTTPCPLCKHDGSPKMFPRTDHLYQHLRTFHKIPAGRIPPEFGGDLTQHDSAEGSTHPQPMPPFPCPVPGCPNIGQDAYLRQRDLDEHMNWMHYAPLNNMSFQQGPRDLVPTYTNNGFQQDVYSHAGQVFGEDVQQDCITPADPAGNFQAEGGFQEDFLSVENMPFQSYDDFNFGFAANFGPNL
ncbi:hypothetical protein F4678DRAFT_309332 [Xylaria arbuscula]|nr:hypothetical protein F4678DRAFT_309332 [Xylaria arbuscula]